MAGFIGNVPAEKYTALQRQTFSSPTGTSHTLSYSVTNSDDLLLYINNVKQDPADYTASGTSLTTPTLVSGDEMYALFYGRATETVNPPDNSVGNSAMADDAVGLAELSATGTASSSTFLRGDNSWAIPSGGSSSVVGTTRNLATASGTQDVTGFGFNPSTVIAIGFVDSAVQATWGFTDFSTERVICQKDGGTSFSGNNTGFIRLEVSSGNRYDGAGSAISDGVRITWTRTGTPTGTLNIYLLGFE